MSEALFTTTEFTKGLGLADTRGWDTIYALKVPVLNEALRKHFKNKGEDATVSIDCTDGQINALLKDWQIVHGSGSDSLKIAITFLAGEAVVNGRNGDKFIYDVAGACAIATVRLGFHQPDMDSAESSDNVKHELRVDLTNELKAHAATSSTDTNSTVQTTSAAHKRAPVEIEELENVVNKSGPDDEDDTNARVLGGMLKKWLLTHQHLFDFVFLSVDIANTPSPDFAWIKPTYVTFAVADSATEEETVEQSIFAVLAMTENRQPGQISALIPAGAIPINENVNAAFLISPSLVLRKIIQPNLHTIFGELPSAFSLSDNGLTLTNVRPLKLQLHANNDKWYSRNKIVDATIPVNQFCLTVSGTELIQEFQSINFIFGMEDELNVQMSLGARSLFGIDEKGRFAMQMKPEPRQSMTASPRPEKVAREMIEGAVLGLVATMVLSFGAEFMAARYAARGGKELANVVKGEGKQIVQSSEEIASDILKNEENVVIEEATSAAGSVSRTVTLEVEQTVETLGSSTVSEEVVQVATSEVKSGSSWGIKDLVRLFLVKTLPMMLGNLAGQLWGQMSSFDMIDIYYTKPEKVPELALFGTNCIQPMVWAKQDNVQLLCAGLNGAFVLGFNVKFPEEGE